MVPSNRVPDRHSTSIGYPMPMPSVQDLSHHLRPIHHPQSFEVMGSMHPLTKFQVHGNRWRRVRRHDMRHPQVILSRYPVERLRNLRSLSKGSAGDNIG